MVRCKILQLIILFLSMNVVSLPQVYPDENAHRLITSGIENIINQNYDDARKDFNLLLNSNNKLPLGKIYLAAAEIAEAYDYGIEPNSSLIKKLLSEATREADLLVRKDNSDIWNHYALALAEGYYAYYEALEGSWLSALSDGLSAISGFEKCLAIDPQFYEANIAIGTYKYWRSKRTSFLNWLPFVNDDREEGIHLLKKSIENSSYNTYLAIHSLLWIYIDRKEFSNAIMLAENALEKYPDSRVFKWALARAYEDVDTKKSIELYYDILNTYPPDKVSNRYKEIVLKHLIAQQYARSGERQRALAICEELLAINNLSDFVKDKLGERIKRIKSLKRELSN